MDRVQCRPTRTATCKVLLYAARSEGEAGELGAPRAIKVREHGDIVLRFAYNFCH